MTLSLLLVADTDSQLLYCEALSRFSHPQPIRLTINVVPRDGTPREVLQRIGRLGRVWQRSVPQLLQDPELASFSAIGVFLTGSKIAEFRSAYRHQAEREGWRPAPLFCGFNGVVLEHFDEAITWRLGYDLICLNGPRDLRRMERLLRTTPYAGVSTALTGLRRQAPAGPPPDRRQRRLVFAEQVAMPALSEERARMVQLLAGLADRCPDWEITIRPRTAPEESTFHAQEIHISETLARELGPLQPANLTLSYAPLAELLPTSRLFATVSSTAFFDALDLGCRPLVMGDFGLANGYGQAVFEASGMVRQFADLSDLDGEAEGPWPAPEWLEWMGYGDAFGPDNLLRALEPLVGQEREPLQLRQHGYVVNASDRATNQLRLQAESLIQQGDYGGAGSLLELAQLQRPEHRNIRRRLVAVRSRSRFMRWLRLRLSAGFRG